MTVSSTENRISYNGNGVTTAFSFPYRFLANADLKVYVGGVLKTLTTDYTITGAGDESGGTVTMLVAPVTGTDNVVILRDPAQVQELDLVENDPLPVEEVEKSLDLLTMLSQRLRDLISRSFTFADSVVSDASLNIPAPEADKYLGWNAAGDGLENKGLADVSLIELPLTVANGGTGGTTAAGARAALGAMPSDINALTGKTTPVDADELVIADSAATFGLRKLTWANLKATLKTYFDTLYVPRSYLAGLTLSTAGSSSTITIAAGQAADSTNVVMMSLASAISKTTSAWAVGSGNGGLDTGTIANNTWYHFYLIRRPDTGVEDVCFSSTPSAPTIGGNIPAAYTQYRHIFAWKTNGSAQWVTGTQTGDYFRLSASVLEFSTTNPGTSAVTATLSGVPTGIKVKALINAVGKSGTNNILAYVSDLSAADEAPAAYTSAIAAPGCSFLIFGVDGRQSAQQMEIMTNTSAQLRYRLGVSGASDVFGMVTLGFTYTRGRDA